MAKRAGSGGGGPNTGGPNTGVSGPGVPPGGVAGDRQAAPGPAGEPPGQRGPTPLSVSQVTRFIKATLEESFPRVLVQGEISNLQRASSGHVYLTLKDAHAQLRGVMWRSTAARLRFDLHDGLAVVATGPLEVYEARGTYQLMIESLVPQGLGALELAFRQLYERLKGEGLFDEERKRPLPAIPNRIALVTSPTGAAVRDMLQVLGRRWPATPVVVLPVAVQGTEAPPQIAAALGCIGSLPGVDLVICGRGGGSLEDLWAFNTEVVARAIHACPVPVISAVGHEVDVTIADWVADVRAATPTEAAELAVPDQQQIAAGMERYASRLRGALRHRLQAARQRLGHLANRRMWTRPHELLHSAARQVDELEERQRRAVERQLERLRTQLARQAAALQALSPLAVLSRGYSVTRTVEGGKVVLQAGGAPPGTMIETLLSQGRLISRVEEHHHE